MSPFKTTWQNCTALSAVLKKSKNLNWTLRFLVLLRPRCSDRAMVVRVAGLEGCVVSDRHWFHAPAMHKGDFCFRACYWNRLLASIAILTHQLPVLWLSLVFLAFSGLLSLTVTPQSEGVRKSSQGTCGSVCQFQWQWLLDMECTRAICRRFGCCCLDSVAVTFWTVPHFQWHSERGFCVGWPEM